MPVPEAVGPEALVKAELDRDRRVTGGLSQGFFIRSLVFAPDGRTLLNPESAQFGGGHFPFAQTKAAEYLPMLENALKRRYGISSRK